MEIEINKTKEMMNTSYFVEDCFYFYIRIFANRGSLEPVLGWEVEGGSLGVGGGGWVAERFK